MGYSNQVLTSDLRPLDNERRLAGIAFCVRGENRIVTQSQSDQQQRFSPYEIERAMKPGIVAVIDAGAQDAGAMIGGFVATSLKAKGCRGLVTNGGVRDSREIVTVGLPTFCRFVTPINASVVIPAQIAVAAIEAAETLDAIEKTITQGIREGGTREQLFKLHPRFAHIRRLKP